MRASALALVVLLTGCRPEQPAVLADGGSGTFRRIAELAGDGRGAEVVSAAEDGMLLVCTDGEQGALRVVDLSDARAPREIARVPLDGTPTCACLCDGSAYVTVPGPRPKRTGATPEFAPGKLVVVDLRDPSTPRVTGAVTIGHHPDSLQVTRIGESIVAVIAIENPPAVVARGRLRNEEDPGSPQDVSLPGSIQVVVVEPDALGTSTVTDVPLAAGALRAAGLLYPEDPQPEFVALHGTVAAVTLQENNGIALVDIADPRQPKLLRLFSTGIATTRLADLSADDGIAFADRFPPAQEDVRRRVLDAGGGAVPLGARMPDAVAFTPDGQVLVTADEGEMRLTGGRGFSLWSLLGELLGEDGGEVERAAAARGLYPDHRSGDKGIEIEGVATARFGAETLAFLLAERGSFVVVAAIDDPAHPRLLQLLPAGPAPEGIAAIPQRGLVVVACEGDGSLHVYQRQ